MPDCSMKLYRNCYEFNSSDEEKNVNTIFDSHVFFKFLYRFLTDDDFSLFMILTYLGALLKILVHPEDYRQGKG